MLQSISFEALPIVFQQAILLARRLGIEYIWIDSLCIVQDSREDWELESVKMCDYYERSFINIATASSPNHGVPFLGEKDVSWSPSKFYLQSKVGTTYEVCARRVLRDWNITDGGVLFSRAWAWQEAAMASRTAFFTTAGLIWECGDDVVAENYNPGLNSSSFMGFSKIFMVLKGALRQLQAQDQSEVGPEIPKDFESGTELSYIFDIWDGLLESYSKRQLTYITDRLPAVSGIAKRVSEGVDGRYLAGLWELNMPSNLCWQVKLKPLSETLEYKHDQYVAPSWSWASIMQGVEHTVEHTIEYFESAVTVLDAQCDLVGLNPFGKVSKGRVILRGKVAEVVIDCRNPLKPNEYTIRALKEWHFMPDCILRGKNGSICRAAAGDSTSSFSAKVSLLFVGKTRFQDDPNENAGHYHALALGKSDDGLVYSRLGLASSADGSFFDHVHERDMLIE